MIPVTREQILNLTDRTPQPVYLKAIDNADAVLARYGINANPIRLAHFFAQVMHECGELSILTESINYKATALIAKYVNVKHPRMTRAEAEKYGRTATQKADQPSIANIIYGGSFGAKQLGNDQPGDGWYFRGHGMMQITGRANFRRIGRRLSQELGETVNLEANPALVLDPRYALYVPCIFWADARQKDTGLTCNQLADRDDITGLTRIINGGTNGLPERKALLAKTRKVWR